MKTENIIHLALGVGLIGFAAYAINKINKQGKEIADLKTSKADKTTLSNVADKVKAVGDDVGQIVNRVKTKM